MVERLRACARQAMAPLYPLAVLAAAWELLSRSGWVSPRLMPSVVKVGQAFVEGLANGDLVYHASISFSRALSGFGLAIVIGVLLGVFMARSRWFEWMVEPIFSFGYPVPKIALYPVFILLLGFGSPSKIALIALECTFPIAVNTYFGIRAVAPRLVWSARNMGAGPVRIFLRVLLPAALPAIMSGIRVALPLSMVVVIITEMIGDSTGLGYYIAYASASFMYAESYAGVIAVALIGFTLDRLLVALRGRIIFWEPDGAARNSRPSH
ncbi:ABC transporter permease [Pigmentiphaga kullae]|uniref:NitT/TauT family transport system permease protein n=1 Tax=Pigmentiphaga kullae TaxID=151784 RepID=A0A4Q7NKH8_9BURK|nr:ABC transporter permease [Pigmentiphaga kullae]RZS85529.1 NitT/TauT family transport system permease protein [Pigmentiphaga kullae]